MNKKPISPVCWVPTVYFAMGLPFVALSMVSVLMFSDMEVSNAQIAFWTSHSASLDIEAFMESVSGDV